MSKEQVPEEIIEQATGLCEVITNSGSNCTIEGEIKQRAFYLENLIQAWGAASSPTQPNPQTDGEVPAISPGGGADGILHDNLMKILTEVENAHLGHDHEKCFKAIWQYANNVIDRLATLRQSSGTVYVPVEIKEGCELPKQDKKVIWVMDNGYAYMGHMDESEGKWWVYVQSEDGEDYDTFSEYDFKYWLKPITLPEGEEAVSDAVAFASWTYKNDWFYSSRVSGYPWRNRKTGDVSTTQQLYQTFLSQPGK